MYCFRKALLAAAAAAAIAGAGTSARAVVINELDYDNPGTDGTEFIELLNNTASAVDLAGYSLVGFNGGAPDDQAYRVIPLSGTIAPGGLFVIGNVVGANNDPTPDTNLFQNGAGDAIGLYSSGTFTASAPASGGNPAVVGTSPTTDNLVAGVVYEGQDSFPTQFELITVDDNNTDVASLQRSPLTLPPGTGPFALASPPTPGVVNVVPEPASLGLVAIAGSLLLLRRRSVG